MFLDSSVIPMDAENDVFKLMTLVLVRRICYFKRQIFFELVIVLLLRNYLFG